MFPDLTRDDVFRLETQRLWLRWPRAADAAAVADIASHKIVAEQTSRIPHPYPSEASNRYILDARKFNTLGEALNLVLTLRSGNRDVIGFISAEMKTGRRAEIGYALHPDYWGQGFMPEAVQAMLNTLFSLTPAQDVVATVRSTNTASRRVLEKCGFRHQGSGICSVLSLGGDEPSENFALEQKVWESQNKWRAPLTNATGEQIVWL
eukprot:gene17901-18132_t